MSCYCADFFIHQNVKCFGYFGTICSNQVVFISFVSIYKSWWWWHMSTMYAYKCIFFPYSHDKYSAPDTPTPGIRPTSVGSSTPAPSLFKAPLPKPPVSSIGSSEQADASSHGSESLTALSGLEQLSRGSDEDSPSIQPAILPITAQTNWPASTESSRLAFNYI